MSAREVVYYLDDKGRCPVLEELDRLTPDEQKKVLAYITLLEEQGETLRRPIADYVGDKLYELRPKAHRVLYFFYVGRHVVILHLFRKKTGALPERERQIALGRMKDIVQRATEGKISFGGGVK